MSRNNPTRPNGNERRRAYQTKCVGLAFELGQLKGQVAVLQAAAAKHLETISGLRADNAQCVDRLKVLARCVDEGRVPAEYLETP